MRHRILIVVVHFKEAARRVSGGASLDTRTTEGLRDLDMRATTSTILYCGPHLYYILYRLNCSDIFSSIKVCSAQIAQYIFNSYYYDISLLLLQKALLQLKL